MIFISYSRMNQDIVLPLVKLLRAAGQDVFVDMHDMEYGKDWRQQITNAINQCDRLLVFWSVSSQNSEAVKEECNLAASLGRTVVPVLLDKTPLPAELERFHGTGDLTSIFSSLLKTKTYRRFLWLSWVVTAAILAIFVRVVAVFGPVEDFALFIMNFIAWLIPLAAPLSALLIYFRLRSKRDYQMLVGRLTMGALI